MEVFNVLLRIFETKSPRFMRAKEDVSACYVGPGSRLVKGIQGAVVALFVFVVIVGKQVNDYAGHARSTKSLTTPRSSCSSLRAWQNVYLGGIPLLLRHPDVKFVASVVFGIGL